MTVVGVSGGSGGVGRAIVEAIHNSGKHTVKVLSRKSTPELESNLGVPIVEVDYANVESLTKALEKSGIEVVISTIKIQSEAEGTAQLNLISAAEKSSVTKRFIPSDFGVTYKPEHTKLLPFVQHKLDAVEALKKSSLEYTLVSNGFFLDYYGLPKVPSYLPPFTLALDIANNAAAIPGTGDTPIVFTHTFDVAKFVTALLDLKEWPTQSIVIGDKITWNKALALAEKAKGTKFTVAHDDLDKLQTFQISELPAHVPVYPFFPKEQLQYILAVFGLWTATGEFDLPQGKTLNSVFPDIKPKTFADIVNEGWKSG